MNPNRLPGVASDRDAAYRQILTTVDGRQLLPGGVIVDGAESRDPLNTGDLHTLRAGLLLGKITSGGKYAPSIMGVLTAAYDASADTVSMTVSAATAVELVRRVGTSGTFKLTGPPAASGVVQTVTVTFSAVNTSSGVITVTALTVDVDEVQTITPTVGSNVDAVQTITPSILTAADCVQTVTVGGTSSGGTLKLGFRPFGDPHGPIRWTDTIAWNGTEATMTTSVNTALDDLLGGSAVVCGTIADTGSLVMVLTFSGAAADDMEQGLVSVDVAALTGASTATIAMTTAGAGTITAGTYRLGITDPSGDLQWTPKIAYDANAAAIITALDDAVGGAFVVATGGPISTPAAVVLTYSGTGYTNLPQKPVQVDYGDLVGCDDISIVNTTAGSGGIRADGDYRIGITDASGDVDWTGPIAANGNAAAINTALDAALGASLVVATGGPFSTPTAIVLTYSGTGMAAVDKGMAMLDHSNIDGCEDLSIAQTTAGVAASGAGSNDFVIGSWVQPTDGSETVRGLLGKEDSLKVTDEDEADIDVQLGELIIGGAVDFSQIINYPSDASLVTYVKAALRAVGLGFTFDDDF